MRTTIDINDKLLKEAMLLKGAATKKELVNGLLEEELRRQRMRELKRAKGKILLRYNLRSFLKFRHHE